MFSNSKKNTAAQIAVTVENTLRPAFVFTEYLKGGEFNPPSGFWTDDYVIGFTYALALLFMKFDFGGDRWSPEKRVEIIVRTFENLCGEQGQQLINAASNHAYAENTNPRFERGVDDATTMYGAITGRLKPDDPNTILPQARVLAGSMRGGGEILGEDSLNSSLGCAILELTINKYIKNEFLEVEEGEGVSDEQMPP